MPKSPSLLISIPFLILSPVAALASNGTLEINQTCALETGCFAGDTPGYPVTISPSAPGSSFVLTGDLSVSNAATGGIDITRNGITIDMNGFSLSGPVTCTGFGSEVSCDGTSGDGIEGFNVSRISVRNDRVKGFGGRGLFLGSRAKIEDVVAEANGNRGIQTGGDSRIRDSTAYQNFSDGIYGSNGSRIEGCTAGSNRFDGIQAQAGGSIIGSTARDNGNIGINGRTGAVVSQNSSSNNESDGIVGNSGSMISLNSSHNNQGRGIAGGFGVLMSDNAAYSNTGDGLWVNSGSTVQRNSSRGNTGWGLRFSGSQASYRENTITGNTAGTVTGTGVNMFSNSCNGSTTCP